jgi:3-oxoacyl-[acyl-carrier protein] reductase
MTQADPRRVAIVTGGSGGIGRAVVERLAADGMTVVVTYEGNKARADDLVDAVVARGGTASAARVDVADEHDVARLFDEAEGRYGGVDVLVNLAGVMVLSPIATLELDALDRMIRTNVRGAFVVAQQAARRLRRGGALITISTSVTRTQLPTYAGYVATKAAVTDVTLILARELRGRDVTVNAVAAGPIATPFFLKGKDDKTIADLAHVSPLERLGRPEDVAEAISFLAGPARWVNGQVLYVNGGLA